MDHCAPRSSGGHCDKPELEYCLISEGSTNNKNRHEVDINGSTGQQETSKDTNAPNMKNNGEMVEPKDEGDTGVSYTDVAISADDVIRAGGLGARDDISSLLPVAIDSTDFEASLRDARDFEEPQGEIQRPGLGWTEPNQSIKNSSDQLTEG